MEEPEKESSISSIPQSWPDNLLGEEHEDNHGDHDDDDGVEQPSHEVTVPPALQTDEDEEQTDHHAVEDRQGCGGDIHVHDGDVDDLLGNLMPRIVSFVIVKVWLWLRQVLKICPCLVCHVFREPKVSLVERKTSLKICLFLLRICLVIFQPLVSHSICISRHHPLKSGLELIAIPYHYC